MPCWSVDNHSPSSSDSPHLPSHHVHQSCSRSHSSNFSSQVVPPSFPIPIVALNEKKSSANLNQPIHLPSLFFIFFGTRSDENIRMITEWEPIFFIEFCHDCWFSICRFSSGYFNRRSASCFLPEVDWLWSPPLRSFFEKRSNPDQIRLFPSNFWFSFWYQILVLSHNLSFNHSHDRRTWLNH